MGYIVFKDEISKDPEKIKTITNCRFHEVRSFLGFIGYYMKYVENFSKVARPMFESLKKMI